MARVVIVYRDGIERMHVRATVRNSVLRRGDNILINNDLIPDGARDTILAQIKTGKITPEIEAMGIRIGDNGNGLVARWYDEVIAEAQAQRQQAAEQRHNVRMTIIRQSATQGEAGVDPCVTVDIAVDGQTLRYDCRNIFDFGYVINPCYSIAAGINGGVCAGNVWMTHNANHGWRTIRALTPQEQRAIAFLSEFHPVPDAIRM